MTGPYEIPAEMRDFAEKSVQQARKAFDGFMGAVQKSTSTAEETAQAAGLGMKDASSKAVSYAQDNISAAFDFAEKMVKAKDVQEVMALQAEYLKSQLATAQEQAKELGEAFKSAAKPKA
ncbi:MAG: phasin [Hyphomicrobiales bacterium]|nr:phasin [Hyphomicrobiales bacterium]